MAPCWFHLFFWANFTCRVALPLRLTSFLCLWHTFCFSCQQFCPSLVCCQLWVLCLCCLRPFRLLFSSEDQAEQRFVAGWAMVGVHGSQSFEVCCHWRWSFPCFYPHAINSWESWEFLLKIGVSARQLEFSRRLREPCVVNCCSTVAARSVIGHGLSCVYLPTMVGGEDHAPRQLFDMLPDGLLDKDWVKGAEREAGKSEYQSYVQEQRQLERTSVRSRPDVENVLTFCSPKAGFRVRSHLYKVSIFSKIEGFSLTATSGSFKLFLRSFKEQCLPFVDQ